jgi:hypothetical protein
MRLLSEQDFRGWAAGRPLLWREEWPQRPQFGPKPAQFAWPWPRPQGWTQHWRLAEFILAALGASSLGQSGGWYLWPRNGKWQQGGNESFYGIRNAILRGLGIHVGDLGAAHFEDTETDALAAAVYACCFMFDDCEGTASDHFDVFPHHGQLGLYFVDEEMFWALAEHKEPVERFNDELAQAGWSWLLDESKNDFVWPSAVAPWPGRPRNFPN